MRMEEETIILQERPPWKAYTSMFVLIVFVMVLFYYIIFSTMSNILFPRLNRFVTLIYIAPIIIALIMIGSAIISRYSCLYTLTNKKAVSRVGLIRRDERTAPIIKITDTRVHQGLWQRLMGYGNVQISTAGSSGYEVNFININNPFYVKIQIDDLIEKKAKEEA